MQFLLDLPWWGPVATLIAFLAITIWFRITFPRKFDRIVREGVLEAGSALKDAKVTLHSVKAVEAPKEPSPYDIDKDDENFMEGVDDAPWDEEGTRFYSIDVTIEPQSDELWDPTGLALVPAEYKPDDEIDVSDELCALYSAEEFVNGQWRPTPEKEIRGTRRLRMVFAVHEHLKSVMFANIVTYFGHVDLPK